MSELGSVYTNRPFQRREQPKTHLAHRQFPNFGNPNRKPKLTRRVRDS